MNTTDVVNTFAPILLFVLNDLKTRYPNYDIEATFKHRKFEQVDSGYLLYEQPVKLTLDDNELKYYLYSREILLRTNDTNLLKSHGYFFSHLGKREVFKIGENLYNVTLEGKRLVDMVEKSSSNGSYDSPFVTDGIDLVVQYKNHTSIRNPLHQDEMEVRVCGPLPGKLLGYDENTSSIIGDNGAIYTASIYESCKMRAPDEGFRRVPLYVSNSDELDLKSQWYHMSHFALFDEEVKYSADGSIIQFKASPRHVDTKLCHDLTKYEQKIIIYLIIVQAVMHVCFVAMVVFVFIVLLYNFWIYKLLKKMSAQIQKKDVKDGAKRDDNHNISGYE